VSQGGPIAVEARSGPRREREGGRLAHETARTVYSLGTWGAEPTKVRPQLGPTTKSPSNHNSERNGKLGYNILLRVYLGG